MINTILNTLASIWDFIFPRYCMVCDRRLSPTEHHICVNCLDSLPRTNGHTVADNSMEQIYWGLIPIGHATAFFYYNTDDVKTIVHAVKYHKHPLIAQYLSQLMTEEMLPSGFFQDVDAIIPMPLHHNRQQKRGYNQSYYIAQGISQATNLPILVDAVQRTIDTDTQTHKSIAERQQNVEDIFRVSDKVAIKGKHILIVDDVITSGATTKSLAKTITEAGCRKISVLSMAYASPHPIVTQRPFSDST